jgi:hypothetical protein
MAKYKQGMSDRMDESLGMRRGKESGMKQSYKDRRDESYGMKDMGVMGHDKKPMKCNAFEAQKMDNKNLDKKPSYNRGYPEQAWDYKY